MNIGATTLSTHRRVWRPLFSDGYDTAVTSAQPQRTPPKGSGTLDTLNMNLAKLCVTGATADAGGKTLYTNVYSYSQTMVETDAVRIYIPTFICRLKWTWAGTGNVNGLAAGDPSAGYTSDTHITDDEYFADAVELIDGDTSIRLITDTSKHIASVTVDLEGGQWLSVTTDAGGATTPTTWNVLAAVI